MFVFLLSLISLQLWGAGFNHWAVPLNGDGPPADDLLYQGRLLSGFEAARLRRQGVDLAKLSPAESAIWSPGISQARSLPIASGAAVDFVGTIRSNQGLLRFNAHHRADNGLYTFYLDKQAHVALLRRALLSRLGYKIAPMKHLKTLSLTFANKETRDDFLTNKLPLATFGAASRWIGVHPDKLGDGQLTVRLQDVVAFLPRQTDHYNVAMGVPPKALTGRTLRALLLPYALLAAGESVNKLPWRVGRKVDGKILLPHFALADMGTTLDDARWILAKMAKLTRQDFVAIASLASLPEPVAALWTEKMIARRNSLMELFSMEVEPLAVDKEISLGAELVKGKLTKQDWEGYASRFAHGDSDSPFKDLEYLGYSIAQSSAITSLVARANRELRLFNLTKKRAGFFKKQFEGLVDHYLETGEVKDVGVKTWSSPVLNVDLIANRNVVFGHYLGTDNLVQMADILGFALTVGGHLGIENHRSFPASMAQADVTLMMSYVHLRPLASLKKVFEEPYSEMLVPLTTGELARSFTRLAREEEEGQREELFERINALVPVGESLIITRSVRPKVQTHLGGHALFKGHLGLSLFAGWETLRRIHLHRRNSLTFDVYDDRGEGTKLSMGGDVSQYIPIFSVEQRRHTGDYGVRFYQVSIDSNLEKNPDYHKNMAGLAQVLSESSTELLDEQTKKGAWVIDANFDDQAQNTNFLFWRSKSLDGELELQIKKAKSDSSYNYVVYDRGHRRGVNWESFLKDIANYYLRDFMAGEELVFQIENNRNGAPGQSIYGEGDISLVSYQARLSADGQRHESPLVLLAQRKRGFSIDKAGLVDYFEEVNKSYGERVFEIDSLDNLEGLWLYSLNVVTTVYNRGLAKLAQLPDEQLRRIGRAYTRERTGSPKCRGPVERIKTVQASLACGNLSILVRQNRRCKKLSAGDAKGHALCLRKLVRMLKSYLEFDDFKEVIGADNYFIFGTVDGFHKNSESLADTIHSHGLGKMHRRYPGGIISVLAKKLKIKAGELLGLWLRESL